MDIATYAVEAAVEQEHWWFVGRRTLFAREIRRLAMDETSVVLDVGSSTGTNLRLLRDQGFTRVTGLDFSEESVRWCSEKGLPPVKRGDVCALPFDDNSFDLVLATDIIEHVEDDAQALREIHRVLKPGAAAIITVPAFKSLWGLQDEVSHHYRRYTMGPLVERVGAAGLSAERRFYFNFLLFGPIWLARQVIGWLNIKLKSENEVNSPLMNRVFGAVFHTDIALAPILRMPFGVSAFVLARKAKSAATC